MPDNAPPGKVAAIRALGAEVIYVPRHEWFEFVIRGVDQVCVLYSTCRLTWWFDGSDGAGNVNLYVPSQQVVANAW